MKLSSMRYKDYIWPSNPGSYRISFRRVVAEHKLPFGRSVTQDLGQVCRVLEGEGEFAGEGAYEEFKRLATVFYGGGAGVLVHPVWMTTRAYFTELEVVQEPVPDYVRYRFAFCEAGSEGAALKEVSTSAAGGSAAGTAGAYSGIFHSFTCFLVGIHGCQRRCGSPARQVYIISQRRFSAFSSSRGSCRTAPGYRRHCPDGWCPPHGGW